MNDPIFILVLFVIGGVLFVALGVPLRYKKVPPNWFYGFRTRKTLSSEEIWYPVNRVTGIDMIRLGSLVAVSALIMLALRHTVAPETGVIIVGAIGGVMALWMLLHGFSVLRRM
jgi:uncharacterized membrane protein